MVNLRLQKLLAASVLKCGRHKIWLAASVLKCGRLGDRELDDLY